MGGTTTYTLYNDGKHTHACYTKCVIPVEWSLSQAIQNLLSGCQVWAFFLHLIDIINQLFYAGYFGLATGATHFVAINTHSYLILKCAQLYN